MVIYYTTLINLNVGCGKMTYINFTKKQLNGPTLHSSYLSLKTTQWTYTSLFLPASENSLFLLFGTTLFALNLLLSYYCFFNVNSE